MFKKSVCLILCIITLCGCFYGCGGVKGKDATVIFPIDRDPEYLDPQIISFVGSKNIIANCFEGLVTIDEKGDIVPGVAEKWESSADGLEYTFYLREDAKWKVSSASGALIGENYEDTFDFSVTAEDFVFAFRRAVLPETKSPGASLLFPVKNASEVYSGEAEAETLGVEAVSRYVLKITLEEEDPDFLYTLLEPACMPCDETFFKATRGRYGLSVKYLIYNGPFYINNWADDASVSLRRNPDYYAVNSVMPKSLYFSINNEQNTRLKKLTDEVYNITPLNKEQAEELSQKPKHSVAAFNNSMLSLIFNCKSEAFSNVSIRRAVAATLDTATLTQQLGAPTAKGVVPSSQRIGGIPYRDAVPSVPLYENSDPTALFHKGLEQLDKSDIEVTVICNTEYEATVRSLMQSWQSILGIGFNIFVESLPAIDLANRVQSGEYDMAFYDVTFPDTTAFSVLQSFTTDNDNNIVGFSSKNYDELVKSIKLTSGESGSTEAAKKAEKYLMKSAVIVPLYENQFYYGMGKEVSGAIFSLSGEVIYMKNMLIP